MGTGFKWYGQQNGERVQAFVDAGVPPQMLHSYVARRWFDDEAVAWAKEGIDAGEAPVWKALGLLPAEAARLARTGARLADTVREWWEAGIPIGDVAACIAAGLTANDALRQRTAYGPRAGTVHIQAGGPRRLLDGHPVGRQFDHEDVAWVREGIDGAEAPVWKALALHPGEARRLVRKGATLAGTVRGWWQAGIPIGEVADWIGAGLTPDEAADQRARGITAEHAATLRALRDDRTR